MESVQNISKTRLERGLIRRTSALLLGVSALLAFQGNSDPVQETQAQYVYVSSNTGTEQSTGSGSSDDFEPEWRTRIFSEGEYRSWDDSECTIGTVDYSHHADDVASIADELSHCQIQVTDPANWPGGYPGPEITATDFAEGIVVAAEQNPTVISLSVAVYQENLPIREAIDYVTQELQIPVMISAGNKAPWWDQSPDSPPGCQWMATLPGTTCVAGVIPENGSFSLWEHSEWDTDVVAADASLNYQNYSEYGTSYAVIRYAAYLASCQYGIEYAYGTADNYPLNIAEGCASYTPPPNYYGRRPLSQ